MVLLAASTSYFLLAEPSPTPVLNKDRFLPCTVVSREHVSSTGFLLTIRVSPPSPTTSNNTAVVQKNNRAIIKEAHEYGLWSVEVKQPQLQIARNYTPLPPTSLDDKDDESLLLLRFFVRRYETGEVSKYLARLGPGDTVEIRGPHLGFDLGTRLGLVGDEHQTPVGHHDHPPNNQQEGGEQEEEQEEAKTGLRQKQQQQRHVVFLAGGTGVAPAMQAARRLLPPPSAGQAQNDDNDKADDNAVVSSVRILWANRAGADCAGCLRVTDAEQQQTGATSQGTLFTWVRNLFFFGGRSSWGRRSEEQQQQQQHQPTTTPTTTSPIMSQLQHLQAEYARRGGTLEVTCTVDDDGDGVRGGGTRRFVARDIAEAVTRTRTATTNNSNNNTPPPRRRRRPSTKESSSPPSPPCFYHSQRHLQESTEDLDAAPPPDPPRGAAAAAESARLSPSSSSLVARRRRRCTCHDDDDKSGPPGHAAAIARGGKNLFLVSGPEGFVGAFAGPKVWARGAERQGPVGGVVAELMKGRDSAAWEDWLVLKL